MSLSIAPLTTAQHLAFTQAQESVSFLQTPGWAGIKAQWRAESLGWFDGTRLVGAGLVLHRPIPRLDRLTLAYLAEGPIIDWTGRIGDWLEPLVSHLKAQGAFAVRMGPDVRTSVWDARTVKTALADPTVTRLTQAPAVHDPVGAAVIHHLHRNGWVRQNPESGFGVGHPQFKYELALRHPDGRPRTDADLSAGMNQQWRRNIATAAKHGVEVSADTEVRTFHHLYLETAERDRFTPRPLSYFETMVAQLAAEDPERIRIYSARHGGDTVAAAILIRGGSRAWYAYGASSSDKREVRGSNALQWSMLRDTRDAGCWTYDLRGITPTVDASDPHVGLLQFKVGLGGQAVQYVGEWDLPLRPLAYLAFARWMQRRETVRSRKSLR